MRFLKAYTKWLNDNEVAIQAAQKIIQNKNHRLI